MPGFRLVTGYSSGNGFRVILQQVQDERKVQDERIDNL